MRLPVIRGCIERRILVNYRVDPDVAAEQLPWPFRPKLHQGYAWGGICLIRLGAVRPKGLPKWIGIRSENAAHRWAVQWNDGDGHHEGVYVVRRDTSLWLNRWAGGRVFPGVHHAARFSIKESHTQFDVRVASNDGAATVHVEGEITAELPRDSRFRSIDEASEFFRAGAIGYSPVRDGSHYEGLELRCDEWDARPLDVHHVRSSYFDDPQRFPPGSIDFDCALLMRDDEHEWLGRPEICCATPEVRPVYAASARFESAETTAARGIATAGRVAQA